METMPSLFQYMTLFFGRMWEHVMLAGVEVKEAILEPSGINSIAVNMRGADMWFAHALENAVYPVLGMTIGGALVVAVLVGLMVFGFAGILRRSGSEDRLPIPIE